VREREREREREEINIEEIPIDDKYIHIDLE
jgi:hypothetical protein